MPEESTYEPEADDILVHRWGPAHDDAYFSLGTGFGKGKPHYFVNLDENGGERSWWLDPEQAIALGRRLVFLGEECQRGNEEQEERSARWRRDHPDRS